MNNILSLKTVGLSYASTNLSFAFALYFNISMFLLYHNPPLFSIILRTCPNVFLFRVQIPVDACTFLGLKRRSFLFVIDILAHAKGAYKTPLRVSFSMQNRGKLPFSWRFNISNNAYLFLLSVSSPGFRYACFSTYAIIRLYKTA